MNFEFAEQINPSLENFNFAQALEIAETNLHKLPSTDFHEVLGKSLLPQVASLVQWIDKFYKKTRKKIDIKALYFELIEFDINTDIWSIAGFAFREDGGLNLDDMEWLCSVTRETMTKKEFILIGYENLQSAFKNIELETDNIQNARDWCEQIIIIRFMELMWTAHLLAKEKKLVWEATPIYFTEHSYSFIVKSEN